MPKEALLEIIRRQETELLRLRQEQASTARQFAEAQRMAKIGYWEWDIRNNVTTWSERAFLVHDIDPGTSVNYDVLIEKVHPEDRAYHRELTERWIRNRGGDPYEYRVLTRNGEVRHIRAFGKVECDPSGQPARFIGALQDVTETTRLQAQLQDALTKALEGFLPICSFCKAIRNEDNEWDSLEEYLHQRSKAQLSHSVCPGCLGKFYGESG